MIIRSVHFIIGITVSVLALLMLLFWLRVGNTDQTVAVGEITPPVNEGTTLASLAIRSIGKSVEGRIIDVYSFGSGDTHLVFVGGIHGGYEWNSVVLANEIIAHFTANLELIPTNLTVSIIPNLNPDGVVAALGVEGPIKFTD